MASKSDRKNKRTARSQNQPSIKTTAKKTSRQEQRLYERVASIIDQARGQVARTVNTAMVHAYWNIGREIVEVEQQGRSRAGYSEDLLWRLSEKLAERFGRGFSFSNVYRMRQFYLAYPQGSAAIRSQDESRIFAALPRKSCNHQVLYENFGPALRETDDLKGPAESQPVLFPPTLSWTHFIILMKVTNPDARSFYEIEAVRENWSTRELERQIGSLLFERLAKSRDRDKVRELARQGQSIDTPQDMIKDPLVLEFLHLEQRARWSERDLETAIIDRLETFLLELGKGFCFVARQKRISLEGDHFYIDLVLYNRLLQGFVLLDLKLGKLTHQDLGQMQMYVNYYDRFQCEPHEAPTVGIVLCDDKNETMVRITLPQTNEQIHAARYQLYLPSEKELTKALIRERRAAERALERGEVRDNPDKK